MECVLGVENGDDGLAHTILEVGEGLATDYLGVVES